mmetsp:Transcript_24648/g.35354  ORF Transcript_24648/g.35354 Transcript_24648/m.35354 type:complete len:87 (-) Transcript_24648:65-325(-)
MTAPIVHGQKTPLIHFPFANNVEVFIIVAVNAKRSTGNRIRLCAEPPHNDNIILISSFMYRRILVGLSRYINFLSLSVEKASKKLA